MMKMRITQKAALGMFNRLARAMGKKVGHYKKVGKGRNAKWKPVSGAWHPNYNAVYGGWIIEEIDPRRIGSTGVSSVLISSRLSTREFYYACWMAARAIESRKRKR